MKNELVPRPPSRGSGEEPDRGIAPRFITEHRRALALEQAECQNLCVLLLIRASRPDTQHTCENLQVPTAAELLRSPEGRQLLHDCASHEEETTQPLALVEKLRAQGIDPALASAVTAQLVLRAHARTKFGDLAAQMLFTRDGLEQATRWEVAQEHAKRFYEAGAQQVADLGCGIATDSRAFAEAGLRVLAVDLDTETCALAAENLAPYPHAQVRHADVTTLSMTELAAQGVDALFADPARRLGSAKGTSRILDPQSWSPPLSKVLSWRETIPMLGVKVAPGIAHTDLPQDSRTEWTSVNGSLVEAAIWNGPLALEGPGRSALVISGTRAWRLTEEHTHPACAPVRLAAIGTLGRYLGEPDDAVIRAGLVARLAEMCGAHLVSESIAYLSSDTPMDSPFVKCFEVIDLVPLKAKAINAVLKTLHVGRVEVKKRGANIDPAALRASLTLEGEGCAVVIATRVAGRHRAIIARRLTSSSSHDM